MIDVKHCPRCQGVNHDYATECLFCEQELKVERSRGGILYWIGVVLLVGSALFWVLAGLGFAFAEDPGPSIQGWLYFLISSGLVTVIPIAIGAFLVFRRSDSRKIDVL